jgi:four helix bundle protein
MIESYRDLDVWQMAVDLCALAYRISAKLPRDERFELSAQIRRAAVSIPANIAEGHARASTKEYARFVSIAMGSLAELETLIVVAERVGHELPEEVSPFMNQADQLGRKLRGLLKSLHSKLAVSQGQRAPAPSPQPRP